MTANVKGAVFASGSGSNFDAINQADIPELEIVLLVCDRPEAVVIEKADAAGVRVLAMDPGQYPDKSAYEQAIVQALWKKGVTWIFLAGYMRLIGDTLLENYEGKIVNIHPSLLPQFPGKDAVGQALAAGMTETGVTIHKVDAGMDTGPVIKQEKVPIVPDDTRASLHRRIQQVEHRLYPQIIRKLISTDG